MTSPGSSSPFISDDTRALAAYIAGAAAQAAPEEVLGYTSDYRNENDAIAKFISEKIVACENGEPVDKAYLRRTFKAWKEEADQRGLLPADMEKGIIERFGKFPPGGWTCFKVT